jgi:hypothetical protein
MDVSVDTGFLYDKVSELGDIISGTHTDLSNTVHSKLNIKLYVQDALEQSSNWEYNSRLASQNSHTLI